jgi:general secretion pathway protein H
MGNIRDKKQQGFTLLETLIVMTIAGLILTIVPPMLPKVMDNTYAKSAARELVANLKHTRSKAITTQKETTLILDIEKKEYQSENKYKKLKLSDETTISLITAKTEQLSENQGQIRFFPDGSSTGGQIKLAYLTNEFLIDVNWLTGKIKILP